MFEAIHGSAPRMVEEGRAQYADPSSMIKAAAMLLSHIGYVDKGKKLEWLSRYASSKAKVMTGRSNAPLAMSSRSMSGHRARP